MSKSPKSPLKSLILMMLILVSGLSAVADTYSMPIGIPEPTFGLTESHEMYAGEFYAAGGFYYKDAGNGPYTHYVDNTNVNATDTDNPYGDPTTPRLTFPLTMPAGSVVEIHGTGYATNIDRFKLVSEGTEALPVFMRGYSADVSITINKKTHVSGEYLIIENLHFYDASLVIPHMQNGFPYHAEYICVRNNEIEGTGEFSSGGGIQVLSISNEELAENIVIFNNEIHHCGQHDATTENDSHAVSLGRNVKYFWMLNNHVHHNGGDSFQVKYASSEPDLVPQYIYVGGNEMHDDGENAVDLKGSLDVVVSENKMYNYDGFTGSDTMGVAFVAHSGPSTYPINVWVLNNEIYNSKLAGCRVTSGDEIYFIGNTVYDITGASSGGTAFESWNSAEQYIINNTISKSDRGIKYSGVNNTVVIENNIFSDLATDQYVILDNSVYSANAVINNNLFYHDTLTAVVDGNDNNSLWVSPDFVDLSSNDFNLSASSPARNAATASTVYQTFIDLYGLDISYDMNGTARPLRSGGDIGAVEFIEDTSSYTMPIGIPEPSFGLNETYRMYDEAANRNSDLSYTQNEEGGYYTHYVDNTSAAATDSSNTYGTLAKPRATIPRFVPAGSVVEIHGGPYVHKSGSALRLDGVGTAEMPIFYRGADADSLVRIDVTAQSGFTNLAHYIIIENLSLFRYSINPSAGTAVSHICLRNSEVSGDTDSGGVSVGSWFTGNWISNIVLYNLDVHDNGLWNITTDEEDNDQDVHGVGIGEYVEHMWILDSKLYHNSGNGIQLTGGGPSGDNTRAHHIYMGRNYDNGQPNLQKFIGIKGSSDVIVSENHVSTQGGIRTRAGMGFQYGPERVWFLFNRIHDVDGGIIAGSNSVANPGEESYFIGNLIYNIYQKDYDSWDPDNSWSNAAMALWGGTNRYVIGNTIYNVDAGIYSPGGGTFNIVNNVISEVTQPAGRHIYIQTKTGTPEFYFYNNLFSEETEAGDVRLQWGDLVGDVAYFQANTANAHDNIDADPLFTNTSTYDLSLQAASPAIDAGMSDGMVEDIFDRFELLYGIDIRNATIGGAARPSGVESDIGAFEYSDAAPTSTSVLLINGGTGDGIYEAGSVVPIVAGAAADGYEFDAWTGDIATIANPSSASTTVTIAENSLTITATYKALPGAEYNLTVNSGSGEGAFEAGSVVTIVADAAPDGQVFDTWTGDVTHLADTSSATTTVTMPANSVSVTATYQDAAEVQYGLVVNSGSGDGDYAAGSVVTIFADAAPDGQVFDAWTGDIANLADTSSATTTVTMPTSAVTVTAMYQDVSVTVPASTIVVESISAPFVIDLNGREFWAFKDDVHGNLAGAAQDIGEPVFTVGEGSLSSTNSTDFQFVQDTIEQASGYVSMKYNEANTCLIPLIGNGQEQTAKIYIKAGVWGALGKFTVTAGEDSQVVDLPRSNAWLRYEVSVKFTDSVDVVIQPNGAYDGYSTFGIAGVVLDKLSTAPELQYSLLVNSGSGDGTFDVGSVLPIIADAAPAGQEFDAWTGDVATLADATSPTTTVTMPAADVTVTATYKDQSTPVSPAAYQMPIGIPEPAFGIHETHEMYAGEFYAAGGFAYKDAGHGPYTHYVDKDAVNATDTDNPYGDPSLPRLSIPTTLPAGSVVEIHGTGYVAPRVVGKYQYIFTSEGTAALPVFVRGFSTTASVVITSPVHVAGEYLIIENLYFDEVSASIPYTQNGVSAHAKYISIRNNEFAGNGEVGSGSVIGVYTLNYDDLVENIVLYNNEIHHYGKHDHTTENDYHAVGVSRNVRSLWMLKNHTHHNGGDSIQVRYYSSAPDLTPQYIYIGDNDMHDDAENAVDLKGCLDVIVSENKMYNYDGFSGTTNSGTPFVAHYDTPSENVSIRVWVIANEVHDSLGGGFAVTSGPDEIYFAANKVYNITNSAGTGTAFISWSSKNQYIVNNTIVNCDRGINYTSGSAVYSVTIENNVFSELTTDYYINLSDSNYIANSTIDHNIFYHSTLTPSIVGNETNSIYVSPIFVDLDNNDLNLSANSPAIDAGKVSAIYQTFFDWYGLDISVDMNGVARPQGSGWDLGAFEFVEDAPLDSDEDGMPDDWEFFYGFDEEDAEDATLDFDLDGMTNKQEYIAGTQPKDALSFFTFDQLQLSGDVLRVRFATELGRIYSVERKESLQDQDWEELATGILGTGGLIEVEDTFTGTSYFYRLTVEMP
ncbi:choice-of-anchor Q domain-containing protein [Kiritimatiellota bacterium B12222]|nr:choice-of-anchor Q domain-containing protein [Kiritimatiellota bacterium B12222]